MKVLKEGTIKEYREWFVATCVNCDCEFEFDSTECEPVFYIRNGETERVAVRVECPCCGYELDSPLNVVRRAVIRRNGEGEIIE